ncbi:uncharacterized protein LOC144555277 [Carex rostrata]
MALISHVREPTKLTNSTRNFSHWKRRMMNYLNVIDLWVIVATGYTPTAKENSIELTNESKENKMVNDNAINIIYSSVDESISMIFGDMTIAKGMWDAIVYKFEGNAQIKQTKLTGLETRFETFDIGDNESIEDMYNRMLQMQNEFVELGEPISNSKIV